MKIKKITIEVETDILEDKTFVLSDFINQTDNYVEFQTEDISNYNYQSKWLVYHKICNHTISIGLRCDGYIMEEL